MSKVIILDNGHGKETAGKRSPIWGGAVPNCLDGSLTVTLYAVLRRC